MGSFTPISEYGVIGNLETCVLVSTDASIDWACFPSVNSSSVFAGILDADRGGRFAISPVKEYEASQQYLSRTNVLQTTFRTSSGECVVTDFMPVIGEGVAKEYPKHAVYRQVTCTEGSVDIDVEFRPRFDYARAETSLEPTSGGVRATSDDERAFLSTTRNTYIEDGIAHATYALDEDESDWYVFQYDTHEPVSHNACEEVLDETAEYWREWSHTCERSECPFDELGHDHIIRSGLVLKLLTQLDTGSICAAPTTSLPESIGGVRNWDYRYSWIRDSAFTIRALTHLGHAEEAEAYLDHFLDLSRSTNPRSLQPLYSLKRQSDIPEEQLDHLSGYRGSKPVRIGNEAANQFQLDIYGELVQAVYQLVGTDRRISEDDWNAVYDIVEYVCRRWDEPDSGIWEPRREERHYVYSKVMCWVAIDRALDMAEKEGFDAPEARWRDYRSDIREAIIERGFDEEKHSFTQTFEGDTIDATGLLIPLMGFLPIDDDRVQGTIETIRETLATPEGFVYRYKEGGDRLPGDEGVFLLCSFWLVSVLARSGRVDRAWEIYDNVLSYSSPVGLLAEQLDVETGQQLGNFPQAFSHIGLLNSALYIAEEQDDEFTFDTAGIEGDPYGHGPETRD
ncbi:glycoside hydrolase family 15 protein [Haladaptatus sp. CMAA 1911]|uniref:glycoside hydrolase family 15 protein n=1 Tax=unclassified Haladaptatus TaxID=2622732 RepID=UPI0037549436